MDVNEWFDKGCNYMDGVLIYGKQKGHSPNLLRLFLRKQSTNNEKKLEYELGKFKDLNSLKTPKKILFKNKTESTKSTIGSSSGLAPSSQNLNSSFYRIKDLHPDLHDLAIKQRNDYQLAISLHSKLVQLHKDQEMEALDYCIQIEDLFDSIEAAQKVLDHYVKHKIVIRTSAKEYKDYNAAELIKAQMNKKTSVSKFKKKVEAAKKALTENLSNNERNKAEIHFQKVEQKLISHEMDLRELEQLINNYDR
tara:strand:- start:473 stop:1225 length:753 start_codon:yes stop_codon:yes gene_type:complete